MVHGPLKIQSARSTVGESAWSLPLVYGVFFASGAAGLIYEIIWVRMLTATFGASLYAMGVVLTAYMGGLAFGAAAIGRVADRMHRPLPVYGVLELVIGASGWVVPWGLSCLHMVDSWAHAQWGQNFAVLTTCRFLAALVLLGIPTTLMGATLPVVSRALVRTAGHLGRRVGSLYAVNTLGAVSGAFVAGFFLLAQLGLSGSTHIAVGLNVAAGLTAIVLSRHFESAALPDDAHPLEPEAPHRCEMKSRPDAAGREAAFRLVLMGAFLTGAVSLAAQVLWARSLAFSFDVLKNTTYCFSAMLTVFLAGLAIGSAAVGIIVDRFRSPLGVYGGMLCGLGLAIAGSVLLLGVRFDGEIDLDPVTQRIPLAGAVWRTIRQAILVLGPPTLLMGMIFPVGVKAVGRTGAVGRQVGWIYSWNTAGAVVGSLAAPFVVVPLLGLTNGLLALAGVVLLAGLGILAAAAVSRGRLILTAAVLVAVIAGIGGWNARRGGLVRLRPGEKLVYYSEEAVATVSVIENGSGDRRICVDDVPVAGTSAMMQTDQKSLAHLPMLLADDPRSALTVGFGSGGASYSYLLHDRLEKVCCVEICPGVVEAAPWMTAANHGFLNSADPRYEIVFDDARAYLRYTNEAFDIIATDCTDLRYKASANLYDLEYFTYCREKLRPGGVVVVWMPLGGLSDEAFRMTLRTFLEIFPEMAVFYMHNRWTHYVLLAGWRDELSIDFRRFREALEESDVRSDLAEIGLTNPYKLLATFVTAGSALRSYLEGAALNTEDRPVLEFEAPKYASGNQTAQSNLRALMRYRVSVRPWIDPDSITDAELAALARFESAVPLILAGQFHERNMDVGAATAAYLAALKRTPEDMFLRQALEFPWLKRLAEQGNPTAWLLLGRSTQLQGRFEAALDRFRRYDGALEAIRGATDPLQADMERQALSWQPTARIWRRECLRSVDAVSDHKDNRSSHRRPLHD